MNNYGDSKLLRHMIFSTAGSFGVKSPKIGKRGFRSQKAPISPYPRKGRLGSKKSPFLYRAPQRKWGVFGVLGGGKWGFLTPKPSFPDFGVFGPCKRQTDGLTMAESHGGFFCHFWAVFSKRTLLTESVVWKGAQQTVSIPPAAPEGLQVHFNMGASTMPRRQQAGRNTHIKDKDGTTKCIASL